VSLRAGHWRDEQPDRPLPLTAPCRAHPRARCSRWRARAAGERTLGSL